MAVVRFPHPPDPGAVANARAACTAGCSTTSTPPSTPSAKPARRSPDLLVRLPHILKDSAEAVRMLRRYVEAADDTVRAAAAAAAPPAIRAAADYEDPYACALLDCERIAVDIAEPTRSMRTIARKALAAIQKHSAALADMRLPPAHPPVPPPNF